MGFEFAKRHYHREGGANHPAFPVVQHGDDLALLAVEIKGHPTVLGVVVDDHALADLDLITWLHGPGIVSRRQSCHGRWVDGRSALAGRFWARFDHFAAKGFAG